MMSCHGSRALVEDNASSSASSPRRGASCAMGGGGGGGAETGRGRGIKLHRPGVEGVDPKDLKGLADEGKARLGSGVVALVGVSR